MIAVYVKPETLTVEQYNKAREALDASGANMEGRDAPFLLWEKWAAHGF